MANWKLDGCCNNEQRTFLIVFACTIVINTVFWRTVLMKPMKLIGTFVHEMGHATACWMTGGDVKAIEVYANEGGVTKYVGGWRWFIIPAGYVGGSFWGAVMIVLSATRISATIIACFFILSMLVSLKFSPNKIMVALILGFTGVTVLALVVEYAVYHPIINYVVLYYGVTIGTFSCYDIYDDLITRTVDGSDAKACNELIPCCLPRCVGVQFVLVALAFQALGIYLDLVWMD